MQLKGKQVVLTGGNGGIGTHLAGLLKQAGADVLIVDRNADHGHHTYICNLAESTPLDTLCRQLSSQPIDILINLAGMMYFGHLQEQKVEQLQTMLRVNLEVPILLSQAVIPGMLERGSGQIVNIGSVFGALPFPHFTTYSATKAGLKGFSEALRREYSGKGIDVTYIAPRAVQTPLNNGAIQTLHQRTHVTNDSPEKVAQIIARAILQKRKRVTIGQPEGIFSALNAIFPALIDRALIGKRDIADEVLSNQHI